MKKKIVSAIILCMLLSACGGTKTNTAEAKIVINKSELFTESEIKAAIGKVKESFYDFGDCKILELFYGDGYIEFINDAYGKEYVEAIYGDSTPDEYRIVIIASFITGDDVNEPLEDNTTYNSWYWFLQRDSADGEWYVVTYSDPESFY